MKAPDEGVDMIFPVNRQQQSRPKIFWFKSFYIIECEHGASKMMVDRSDMRGLVTYLTCVRREAVL